MFVRSVLIIFVLVATVMAHSQETKASKDARMKWFREARFGMFIHWGTYSVLAGEYNGKKTYGEWIREEAHIPVGEYEKVKDRFNPVKFDAQKWAALAKEAGMRYITITTKHHEGFALYDSKVSDYDVMNTPFKRDIMKELSAACADQKLQMCWYHSIMDWHHPDYLPRRTWELASRPADGADMDRFEAYLHSQVTELLTNYGKVGVMWFDGEWESTWNHERGQKLYDLCRKLQPSVIVNNRVDVGRGGMAGLSDAGFAGDYGTPEQEIPATGMPGVDWETCMTMNDHWGYCQADLNFKSTKDIIRMLCDIASKGGNYLLNVGPTPEGEIPPQSIQRLHEIGAWMKTNSPSIYGTSASVFKTLPWGRCTVKQEGISTHLYLQVFDWPSNGRLVVPGIGNDSVTANLLNSSQKLKVTREGSNLVINVPKSAPDAICSVVDLLVKGNPMIFDAPEIVAESSIFVRPITIMLRTKSVGVAVRYTLDGTAPNNKSSLYLKPLVLNDSATVRAQTFYNGKPVSDSVQMSFEKVMPWPKVTKLPKVEQGISVGIFDGQFEKVPSFESLKPTKRIDLESITIADDPKKEWTARLYSGYISISEDHVYKFAVRSDDGSRLWIDGQLVVNNDGLHSPNEVIGVAPLSQGWHHIRVDWFNASGGADLLVRMAPIGQEVHAISKSNLMRKAN